MGVDYLGHTRLVSFLQEKCRKNEMGFGRSMIDRHTAGPRDFWCIGFLCTIPRWPRREGPVLLSQRLVHKCKALARLPGPGCRCPVPIRQRLCGRGEDRREADRAGETIDTAMRMVACRLQLVPDVTGSACRRTPVWLIFTVQSATKRSALILLGSGRLPTDQDTKGNQRRAS